MKSPPRFDELERDRFRNKRKKLKQLFGYEPTSGEVEYELRRPSPIAEKATAFVINKLKKYF